MAFHLLKLGENGETTTVSPEGSEGYIDGDSYAIQGLGNHNLVFDGTSGTITSITGVKEGATPAFSASDGGEINISSDAIKGMDDISSAEFNIDGASTINFDASDIEKLNGMSDLSLKFTGEKPGTFNLGTPTSQSSTNQNLYVEGMKPGDQINTTDGNNWDSYEYDGATQTMTLTAGNSSFDGENPVYAHIPMDQAQWDDFRLNADEYMSDGSFTYPGEVDAVCFAAGTMIATPDGEVAVEKLKIGDLVSTTDGKSVPVKWLGRQTMRNIPAASKLQPVRIAKGALSAGKPNRDLVLTASHGMIIDGLVINAGVLVNCDSIDFLPWNELPDRVTYYHIETENHEVVLANGAEAETYVDYVTRQAFDNYDEYVDLYGLETRIVEMPVQRISARRFLPLSVRHRLGIRDEIFSPVINIA